MRFVITCVLLSVVVVLLTLIPAPTNMQSVHTRTLGEAVFGGDGLTVSVRQHNIEWQ